MFNLLPWDLDISIATITLIHHLSYQDFFRKDVNLLKPTPLYCMIDRSLNWVFYHNHDPHTWMFWYTSKLNWWTYKHYHDQIWWTCLALTELHVFSIHRILIGDMDGEVPNIKKWIVFYPVYINSKKTIAEGRRLSTSKACENPTCAEIGDCCSHLKLPFAIEVCHY